MNTTNDIDRNQAVATHRAAIARRAVALDARLHAMDYGTDEEFVVAKREHKAAIQAEEAARAALLAAYGLDTTSNYKCGRDTVCVVSIAYDHTGVNAVVRVVTDPAANWYLAHPRMLRPAA